MDEVIVPSLFEDSSYYSIVYSTKQFFLCRKYVFNFLVKALVFNYEGSILFQYLLDISTKHLSFQFTMTIPKANYQKYNLIVLTKQLFVFQIPMLYSVYPPDKSNHHFPVYYR